MQCARGNWNVARGCIIVSSSMQSNFRNMASSKRCAAPLYFKIKTERGIDFSYRIGSRMWNQQQVIMHTTESRKRIITIRTPSLNNENIHGKGARNASAKRTYCGYNSRSSDVIRNTSARGGAPEGSGESNCCEGKNSK